MNDIKLKCNCGSVHGVAHDVTPESGIHIVCYCSDCQSFAHYLGDKGILDKDQGTDIFQMSYAKVEITSGAQHLRSIKLTPKGLIRWYADCCKTPIGNTVSSAWPFVGLIHTFVDEATTENNFGPIWGRTLIPKNSPRAHLNTPLYKMVPRIIRKMLLWKIRDLRKTNPFFNSDGTPVSKPEILST
jgi:hypothetical protein